MCDYENTKAQNVADYGQATMGTLKGAVKISRADLLEKQAYSLKERAEKAEKAANFLKAHPEFELFLNLQREGVFQEY